MSGTIRGLNAGSIIYYLVLLVLHPVTDFTDLLFYYCYFTELISRTKQMTVFYMKRNTVLKWINLSSYVNIYWHYIHITLVLMKQNKVSWNY